MGGMIARATVIHCATCTPIAADAGRYDHRIAYPLCMDATIRNDSPPVERWVSVAEAATRLGVAAPTVRRWVHAGHLDAVQPGGPLGVMRIPETELKRLAGQDRP